MRFILISTLSLLVLAVCLSIISANLNVAFADDSLDGKSFLVKLHEHGKDEEATDDELIFKGGTFFSADCEQYGFSPASYETKSKGDTTLFESTLVSDKEGKAEWEGAVKGDEITGTFIWSKEGQEPIIYSYEGSIKK
ncbi:MAG: hypothetical protein RIG61_12880 [Deltaproteobacteria bacterium]